MSTQWTCPIHGTSKWVKPGVSTRTGQPYSGFFACTERDCKEKPPKERPQTQPVTQRPPAPQQAKPNSPDWARIAEGKCRSLAICAWIQSSLPLDQFWPIEKDVLNYMLTGAVPGFDERALDERWEDVPFAEE